MNIKSLMVFGLITLGVLLGVGGLLWQFGQSTDKPIAQIAGDKHLSEGSGNVILVEFSDFQCPACLAVQAPLKQILTKYEGKVEFVYRYFPLTSIHKNAMISAQAAEAAYLQNKFWEMHDKLFETQANWQGLADPREVFVGYAKEMGMDTQKFTSDMESQSVKDAIGRDLLASTQYRLTGTPTFFLNGTKVEFSQIEQKIIELAK